MKYILAKSAAEALEALLAEEGKARIIAGGSDVMVDMEAGKLAPQTLVDITTADDMKGIRIQDDQLIIGAAVTLTEIARSPLIRQYFPSLCKGAGSVGSLQIRNSATLVGNVVTAQPAADAAMAVAPLDPRFVVLSKDGIRELAMGEMYAGFGKSTLNSTAEVVKEIHIPLPADDEKASFVRLELRKSLSLPMLNVAAMAKVTDGVFQWVRITMGPVGVGPTRAFEAEEWLKGKALTPENMAEAGRLALHNAKPRSNPLRGSKKYREHALPILVRRALEGIAKQRGLLHFDN